MKNLCHAGNGLLGVLMLGVLAGVSPQAHGDEVDFAAEVRPIFVQQCYDCHGPDDDEGGLQFSDYDTVFNERPSGRTPVIPGDHEASELIERVTSSDPEHRMPPKGEPLTEQQVDVLRQWIDGGAEWDDTHWAYTDLERPEPPEVEDGAWVRNEIDRFILANLEAQGIAPSPEADKPTLIRRLYLDLLGLPPTPEQVDAFLEDDRPDAWERLVDDLLASPHFGERWGRHWLDMARYADSDGYLNDNERPDAWRYRDWVINAINDDMPFDEFTVKQLAGDLLEDAGPEERLATAFHRQTLTNKEAGVDKELYRVEAVFDRVETTSQVWLGLTARCARCHDHKYDKISQSDYFEMFAVFNNADESRTRVPGTTSQQQKYELAKQEHAQKLAEVQEAQQQREQELDESLAEWSAALGDRVREAEAGHEIEPANIIKTHPGGVEFTDLDDGSFLASGNQPDRVKYMIDLHVERDDVVGFHLEALPHEDLPAGGPGRAGDGTFVVSELRAFAKDGPDVSGGDRLKFAGAESDQPTADYPPEAALDGDNGGTGWGIDTAASGEKRVVSFLFEEPLSVDELTAVRVVIDQQYQSDGATLGRFRLSLITEGLAEIPEPVQKLLATDPDDWDTEEREQVLALRMERDDAFSELQRRIDNLEENAPERPVINARVMSQRDKPRETHVMERGEYEIPGDRVYPGTIETLHPLEPRGEQADRLDLARWLVDDANPLTPRVTANHIWMRLFGEGLVRTPDDFGVRGDPPTHPGLLNWLADTYRARDWSRKEMIRTIVNSATYRMSSAHRTDMRTTDPMNETLHRQNRVRVEAEIVRDLSLASAGLLTEQIGGRSVFPPMQEDPTRARSYRWDTETDEQRYRRGMYTFFKRTAPFPNLVTFDCPDSTTSVVQRRRSNTPIQALTTLNNEVFAEAARAMGQRLRKAADSDEGRLTFGFRVALSREPQQGEIEQMKELLDESRRWYEENPDGAAEMIQGFADPEADAAEQAAWAVVASTLLNLDEFIMRD